jgi:hypothetical protein
MLRGAAAGAVGAVAMMLIRPAAERVLLGPDREQEAEWEHVVRKNVRRLGVDPSKTLVRTMGALSHIAYGAVWGALYAACVRDRRPSAVPAGLTFGAVCYAANYRRWGLVPTMRVLPPDTERPVRRAVIPVVTHTVFGLTVAAIDNGGRH